MAVLWRSPRLLTGGAAVVVIAGGGACGWWTAVTPETGWPLVGLALVAALACVLQLIAVDPQIARGSRGVGQLGLLGGLAAATALSGVAGRTFGYAGTDLTEVDELLVPMVPLAAGLLWWSLVPARGSGRRGLAGVRRELTQRWPLWGLAGWAAATALWGVRPAMAALVGGAWILVLGTLAMDRRSALGPSVAVSTGVLTLLVASNVRAWLSEVARPVGFDGPTVFPVDKIVGFAEDSTELADIAVVGCFFGLLLPSRTFRAISVVVGLTTVVRADQRAAVVAVVAGAVVLWWTSGRPWRLALSIAVMVAMVVGGTLASAGVLEVDVLARFDDRSDLGSLTGRTDLWEQAFTTAGSRSWIGLGPGAEETLASFRTDETIVINVHNRVLQWWVTLGLPGLLLCGICGWWIGRTRRRLPPVALAAAVAILASGSAVPGFGGVGPVPATLALAVLVSAASSVRELPEERHRVTPPRFEGPTRRSLMG